MENDIWVTKVVIKNFQSHKDTAISFTSGTNALVGSSNSGKSAVIRAIKWCLLNTPGGTDFIRLDTKKQEAMVRTWLSNGKSVERRRKNGGVNLYRLYEGEELIEEYTGFGSSVPPDIIEAHGMVPITDKVFFQFSDQLEAPFMLSLKPKKRAEVLGDLEELEKIDQALTSVNDDIRVNSKRKKEVEIEEKELTTKYHDLKREADRLGAKIETLKTLKEGLKAKDYLRSNLERQLVRLKQISETMKTIDKEIKVAERIIAPYPENLEEKITRLKYMQQRMMRLKEIRAELDGIDFMYDDELKKLEDLQESIAEQVRKFQLLHAQIESLKKNEQAVESIKGSYSEKAAGLTFEHIDQEVAKYKMLFQHLNNLKTIEQNSAKTAEAVEEAKKQIDARLEEFVAALHEAQVCPTCGRETTEVHEHTLKTII